MWIKGQTSLMYTIKIYYNICILNFNYIYTSKKPAFSFMATGTALHFHFRHCPMKTHTRNHLTRH